MVARFPNPDVLIIKTTSRAFCGWQFCKSAKSSAMGFTSRTSILPSKFGQASRSRCKLETGTFN